MTISKITSGLGSGWLAYDITGAAAATNGGLGAIANPEGCKVLITRSIVYVVTASTGAANLGIGVAANATTKATDIFNDLAVNGAIGGKVYNASAIQATAKTEITEPAVWDATEYVTLTGSASTAGFTGVLMLEYVRLED